MEGVLIFAICWGVIWPVLYVDTRIRLKHARADMALALDDEYSSTRQLRALRERIEKFREDSEDFFDHVERL